MLTNRFIQFFMILIILFALIGCTLVSDGNHRPNPSFGNPTMFVSATVTSTILPERTAVASPTMLIANTPKATSTQLMTLEPDKAREEIRLLFAENTKCDQPCIWGIVPGQTTLNQAQDIFKRIGYPMEFISKLDGFSYYETHPGTGEVSINISLTEKLGVIESIYTVMDIGSLQLKSNDSWKMFTIPSILKVFGKPSDIRINIYFPLPNVPNAQHKYYVDLYFEDIMMLVSYEGAMIVAGDYMPVCPNTDQFSSVRVRFGKHHYEDKVVLGYRIEEVSSVDIEEFYEGMVGETDFCFSILGSKFST